MHIFKYIERIERKLRIIGKKIELINIGIEELLQISKLSSPNYLNYLASSDETHIPAECIIIPRVKALDKQRKRLIEEISNIEKKDDKLEGYLQE